MRDSNAMNSSAGKSAGGPTPSPRRAKGRATAPMEVAIFGAGIAGLVSAIAIRRAGHKVTIYERSRESRDAGMGFILVPEVRQQLEKLGVRASGVPLNEYHCRNEAGQVLYSEKILEGTGSVLRRDFVGALEGALDAETEIHFDEELA